MYFTDLFFLVPVFQNNRITPNISLLGTQKGIKLTKSYFFEMFSFLSTPLLINFPLPNDGQAVGYGGND